MEAVLPRQSTFLRDNALSLAAIALFLASFFGQAMTGWSVANDEAIEHGERAISLSRYLTSGGFVEATFENWESEFLQMGLFVLLTRYLRQRGSSESKSLDDGGKPDPVDEDPRTKRKDPNAPWPVRRGGLVLKIYERSLSLAMFALFILSFCLHAAGGARQHNLDASRHAGGEALSTLGYMSTAQFWFESFQNWQSEFLSVAVLVLLSIVLRERGSAQSKRVAAPHAETGD